MFAALFSTCGQVGHTGPSQGMCDASYVGSTLEGAVMLDAGIQEWVVPYTASYQIEVWGARGGGGNGGNGGGGGGGYAGGDGGGSNGTQTGKGGESYNDGANPQGEDGNNAGPGQVQITLLP